MIERVVRFGEGGGLVGVLTDAEPDRSRGRPTVVLLNSGILHRVGASRLHVTLARTLAGEGIATLRFDLSGIGDSEVRRDGRAFRSSSVLETREAMEFLADTRETRTFILGGLCSGAEAAFRAALADERVVGLIQMDGFAYPTPRFHLNRLLHRLTRPWTWPEWIEARSRDLFMRLRASDGEGALAAPLPGYRRTFPPRAEVAHGLQELAARGTAFYLFFSGSHRPYLNHAEQYARSFPEVDFRRRLDVDFVPAADHTVTGLRHQRFLVTRIIEWARTHWPESASDPPKTRKVLAAG